jgi:F-type H+-transporting ATPase subunit epsilon
MHVTVISPERGVFDGAADAVVAPAFDGQVGILPGHAPFMTLLGKGVLTVQVGAVGGGGGGSNRFEVSGGFLQVVGDAVRIVADQVQTS